MIGSIIFDRNIWPLEDAYRWIIEHGFKTSFYGKPVHITKNYYRFRQSKPNPNDYYFTKSLRNGIKLIIMGSDTGGCLCNGF